MTAQELRSAILYAPKNPGPIATNLRGWWLPDDYYVCARCVGRLHMRGVHIPGESVSVWADRAEPYGDCCICEMSALPA